jgi:PHD/YefM family antitoxin component YafN of YafNO toxin-antitoxin module
VGLQQNGYNNHGLCGKKVAEVEMLQIQKEYIVDEAGNPNKVIISLADFRLIEEMLGIDLDENTLEELRQARYDRESGVVDAYLDLDAIA